MTQFLVVKGMYSNRLQRAFGQKASALLYMPLVFLIFSLSPSHDPEPTFPKDLICIISIRFGQIKYLLAKIYAMGETLLLSQQNTRTPRKKACFLLHKTDPAVKRKRIELNRIFFDPVQDFILKIKKVFNSFHSLLVKIRRSSVRKTLDSHL